MKQVLSIFIVALLMSACQSPTAKNENANFPSSETAPVSSSEVTTSEPPVFSPNMPTHNPAHGQPYHDCALPVGAPLVVNEPEVVQPEALKEEVKLNPEHGLPGHRCDLAVGSPLT